MPNAVVIFRRCIQDAQEYGSNDEFMVSRVFFMLEIDGKHIGEFHSDLKQTVGSDYETGAIEVGPPAGYDGPWSHHEFQQAAEAYFRGCVGSTAWGIRIEGGTNIRMQNNCFDMEKRVSFTIPK